MKLYRIRCFDELEITRKSQNGGRLAHGARSAKCLQVAAKTRTKHQHAISRRSGEKGNMALLADARRHLSAKTNPYTAFMADIHIHIDWFHAYYALCLEENGCFYSQPVSPIMDSFAPEVTVESYLILDNIGNRIIKTLWVHLSMRRDPLSIDERGPQPVVFVLEW